MRRAGLLALTLLLAPVLAARAADGLLPGERLLTDGEMCPAALRQAMTVGAARMDVCSCGGREAHYRIGPDQMDSEREAGHEHNVKRARSRARGGRSASEARKPKSEAQRDA